MKLQELTDGLAALGFVSGYAIGGDPAEIILWENSAPQPTEEELASAVAQGALIRQRKAVEDTRRGQYQLISDPLYFGWQRGDNTKAEWLAAVDKIKTDNPYPEVAN